MTSAADLAVSTLDRGREAACAAGLHWALRLSCGFCFVGHGAFGVITKAGWLPFFALFGISEEAAFRLMPVVGAMDIAVGVLVLLRPNRVLLVWMLFWTAATALLRPAVGMGWFEFLERAGNYGPPLALLMLYAWPRTGRGWLEALEVTRPSPVVVARVARVLRISVSALLLGHAGLAIGQKVLLVEHLRFATGFIPVGAPETLVVGLGVVELVLGLLVLATASRPLLIFVFVWKVASESLFPLSGDYLFEFIERAGSYGAPVALALLLAIGADGKGFANRGLSRLSLPPRL